MCDQSDSSLKYNYYIGRSQAYLKLKNYNECLNDAENAFQLNPNDSRAYLKKGYKYFFVCEYFSKTLFLS